MKKTKSKVRKHNKKTVSKIRPKTIKPKRLRAKPVVEVKAPVPVIAEKPKREKKAPIMYFTAATEESVIKFNAAESDDLRNHIYETEIKVSFEKLVENIFNTFKFSYFETSPIDVQRETVAHLVANINKYNPAKGKAFGYFSIIAKHYLIFHNNNNYKRFRQHVDIADTPSESSVCLQVEDPFYKDVETKDFIRLMVEYWENNIQKIFTKQKDLNIANAVIELFRNCDRIEAYNKKALYLYIREISSCKTQQITKVVNKMKSYQEVIAKNYLNEGYLKPSY
jgi:hypothetical protein